jgi:hypothetical protein
MTVIRWRFQRQLPRKIGFHEFFFSESRTKTFVEGMDGEQLNSGGSFAIFRAIMIDQTTKKQAESERQRI